MHLLRIASFLAAAYLLASPAISASVPGTDDVPALAASVRDHETEVTKRLLAGGERVDEIDGHGWSALMYAAARGDEDAIRSLLGAGAAIDHADRTGTTALMQAAKFGERDAATLLLDSGASPVVRTSTGEAAIDFAVRAGKKDVVKLLTKEGYPAPKPAEPASVHTGTSTQAKALTFPEAFYTDEAVRRHVRGETVVYVRV